MIKEAIAKAVDKKDLNEAEMMLAMDEVMGGRRRRHRSPPSSPPCG